MTASTLHVLLDILKRRATPPAWSWFEAEKTKLKNDPRESVLLGAYTAAARQLGAEMLNLTAEETAGLRKDVPLVNPTRWRLYDLGRAALLLEISGMTDSFFDLALACYEMGDSSEQESWLKTLSLLPACDRFLASAIDACRTNILPLFESIACENPYPCKFFPELNFNQMVLKSLFNGISLSRIAGIDSRFNDDLSRMADDYVSEREAAGRDIPVDIWLVVAPKVKGEGLARVRRYLDHPNSEHRHWAAIGLGYRKD